MTTYIPSDEELRELGFENRKGDGEDFSLLGIVWYDTVLNEWCIKNSFYGTQEFHFTPVSKEHLESIILAFQPL